MMSSVFITVSSESNCYHLDIIFIIIYRLSVDCRERFISLARLWPPLYAVDNAKKEFDEHPTLEQCDRNDNVMAVEQGLISRGDREA